MGIFPFCPTFQTLNDKTKEPIYKLVNTESITIPYLPEYKTMIIKQPHIFQHLFLGKERNVLSDSSGWECFPKILLVQV